MEEYSIFAKVYDTFMEEVPYDAWRDILCMHLRQHGITDGLVAELGCGTGQMTRRLRDAGYDMIGIDRSVEMLDEARRIDPDTEILYLCQDMTEMELYGTVRAIVSVCDSMNYLTDPDDMLTVFRLVNNYLDPGGIFLFDLNTVYKYETVLGDCSICENREHESFIWENFYDAQSGINEYDMTFFLEEKEGWYRKYEEIHYQRAYTIDEIETLLKESGLRLLGIYGEDGSSFPDAMDERIYVVAQEAGKV